MAAPAARGAITSAQSAVLQASDLPHHDERIYLGGTNALGASWRLPWAPSPRLRRVLRRAGATCDPDAIAALAEGTVSMRLPTIGTASAVVSLLGRRGTRHLDRAQVDDECWSTLLVMADPRWLRTLARRERRKTHDAAPSQATGAGTAPSGTAPTGHGSSTPATPPPGASDGGGLANAA
jgi:hypothetical protein